MNVPDAAFSEPRLAEVYDALDAERSDLDAYVAMVDEFAARSVLDIGCGTGTFACMLSRRGVAVVAVDPAEASISVARRKSGAYGVRWVVGDANVLPPLQVDLATMTGNVAQVFVSDADWEAVLSVVSASLRPGGRLVFEMRDPNREAWKAWTRETTQRRIKVPGAGAVRTWDQVVEVTDPLVRFRATFVFEADATVMISNSTLRFRSRDEITDSLTRAGFAVEEVRDASDRPGLEMVFVARRLQQPVMADDDEPVLLGGSRTKVYRVGRTVVRSAGPWSQSIHALLRHLEARGFDGSPRVIGRGFDHEGREVLSYLEGDFVHPHAWNDHGISALGRLLRRFHDATAGFVPPPRATWQPWFTRSDAPDAICGHGDLGPWNIVARNGLPVGFIDWEFAGPVDRLDEVAQVAWLNAQLHDDDVAVPNRLPPPEVRARQLRLFADAYELTPFERAGLVDGMIGHAVRDAANEIARAGSLKMPKFANGPVRRGLGGGLARPFRRLGSPSPCPAQLGGPRLNPDHVSRRQTARRRPTLQGPPRAALASGSLEQLGGRRTAGG